MKGRVLIISPVPTHPLTLGNRVRIFSLINDLKKSGYETHFAHIKQETGDDSAMAACWGNGFHSIGYQKKRSSFGNRFYRKIKAVTDPSTVYTYGIDEWYDNSVDRPLGELQSKYKFDVVIVEYVFFSKALDCFPADVLKIIDTHDVFTNRHKLYLENGEKPKWFSTSQRQEAKGLRRADVVIAIQDNERALLAKYSGKPVITVGHSVELVRPVVRPKSDIILYIGSRNSINIQSVNKFIADVLPEIHRNVPSAKLYIAGNICDEIASTEGVVKMGRIDDLKEAYEIADVVINPMLYGTGLKVKNIEALGFSRSLVTTSAGAKGLEAGIETAFLVADTSEEWAQSVIRILQDSQFRKELEQQAYQFAANWNKDIADSLMKVIHHNKLLEKVS